MIRFGKAFLGGALALAVAWSAAQAHDAAPLRGRLVFADHERPVVRVLDLDTADVTHEFSVPRPNPVFAAAERGRIIAIRTRDEAGTVRFLDTGLVREDHGDHVDLAKADVRWLDVAWRGDSPSHVVSAEGLIAVFFDGPRPWERQGDPKVVVASLDAIARGEDAGRTWKSPGPQHGIAVPLASDRLLVSLPNPAYVKGDDRTVSSRPNGFVVLDTSGDPATWRTIASFNDAADPDRSCRLYHGYARQKATHLFGCVEGPAGGILAVSGNGDAWQARRIAYHGDGRVSTIRAGAGRYAVGNFGTKSPYAALVRIDPAARQLAEADIMAVPGGQPACQFLLSANGQRLANLTPDGMLRIYDIEPVWKEVASFAAVAPFDCAFGAATPTPGLAVIGKSAFVSDPANGRIRDYDLETLKQGLDLPVGGVPTALAVTGD